MRAQKLSVGILAPSPETRESLSRAVEETNIASVDVTVDKYCATEDDIATRQFLEFCPDVILVDLQDQRAGIKTLCILRSVLPKVWLCAFDESRDPRLIVETMQTGAREFLPKPISTESLGAAFTRYLDERKRIRPASAPRGKIYSVTSAKGGSGATSIVVNLAAALAGAQETRVAVLDLNSPSGDAAGYLNAKPQFSLLDALAAATRLDPVLIESFMTDAGNVSLLSGPEQFKTGPTARSASLAKLFRVVSEAYTHAFVDFPPTLDPGLLQTITDFSTAVLVVITPDLLSLRRTKRFLAFMVNSGCGGDRLRLIVNRDNSRDYISVREITRILEFPIYGRLPNDYRASFEAISKGRPVVNSGLAAGYRKLIQDLTGVVLGKQHRHSLKISSEKKHPRHERILPL